MIKKNFSVNLLLKAFILRTLYKEKGQLKPWIYVSVPVSNEFENNVYSTLLE